MVQSTSLVCNWSIDIVSDMKIRISNHLTTVCCYLLLVAGKVDPIDNVEWLLDFSCVSVEIVADDRAEVDFQRSKRVHRFKVIP